jgi:hypothetical protein
MTKLKLATKPDEEPTRQMIAQAEINQDQSEWSGPCGKTEGWKPVELGGNSLDVDSILKRADVGRYVALIDKPVPGWLRLLRWIKGIR